MADEATNETPVEGVQTTQAAETPAETLLAGKYRTPEELERGYLELQRKLGRPADETPPPGGGELADAQPTGETTPPPPATVQDVLSRAGLNQTDLANQYLESGQLTAEQYEKLAQQGYPREIVDGFYAGQMAQIQAVERQAADIAGGQQGLETLLSWAGKTMDDGTIAAMNARLADPSTAIDTVRQLKSEYDSAIRAGGSRPLIGGGTPPPAQPGFTNHHDYLAFLREVTRNGRRPTPSELERIRQTPLAVTQGRRID